MKPSEVSEKHESMLVQLGDPFLDKRKKLSVGDKVRISKQKVVFSKGYTPSWTTEIFTVTTVQPTTPTTYLLSDSQGEPVKGAFYKEELAHTNYPDVYLVEKVLRYSKDKKKAYVKFLGFPQPSWIMTSDIA